MIYALCLFVWLGVGFIAGFVPDKPEPNKTPEHRHRHVNVWGLLSPHDLVAVLIITGCFTLIAFQGESAGTASHVLMVVVGYYFGRRVNNRKL